MIKPHHMKSSLDPIYLIEPHHLVTTGKDTCKSRDTKQHKNVGHDK